jgi:hypothetical protein
VTETKNEIRIAIFASEITETEIVRGILQLETRGSLTQIIEKTSRANRGNPCSIKP